MRDKTSAGASIPPKSAGARAVDERLARLGRRGRTLAALSGVGWCLVAATASLTVFTAALGWWGGDTLRVVGWLSVVVAVVVVFGLTVVGPLQSLASPEMIARRIGKKLPEVASHVLSACQLSRAEAAGPFSKELVARHLAEASGRLSTLSPDSVFPRRALAAPFSAVLASGVVSAALFFAMPGVMSAGADVLFTDPRGPGLALVRKAKVAPVVRDLTFTLYYPEYLDRQPRRFDAASGGVIAPIGTSIAIEAQSLLPDADRGVLTLPGGEVVPLHVLPDGGVRGRFTVSAAGAFRIALGSESKMTQGPDRSLEIEADHPPIVTITRPTDVLELDENGEEIIEFEASDDNGIDRIDLVFHDGLGKEARKTIVTTAQHVTSYLGRYKFSPEGFRWEGGARAEIEFEVFDNDVVKGPKPGRSKSLVVKLMTRASRHDEVLTEQGKLLDDAVDLLAARLVQPAPVGASKDPVSPERFEKLRLATEELLGRAARLIHRMNQDPYASRSLIDAVIQLRDDLANQLVHESHFYGKPLGQKKQRQSADRVTVKILEAAVLRMDDLMLDQQLSRLVADGGLLERTRAEMEALIAAFEKNRTEPARRALMDAVSRLEQLSRRLEQGLSGIRGEVVEAYVNAPRFAVLDLGGQLAQLKAFIASDSLGEAAKLAANLEQNLSRLLTSLESGRLSYRRDRFGEGEKFLGDLMEKLLALESEQLQLRRSTTAVQRWYQERLMDLMSGRIEPLVKRQLAAVGHIEEILAEVGNGGSAEERELIVRTRVAARELELALGQGDLDEARQLAEDLADSSGGVDEGAGGQLSQKMRAVGRAASELAEELTQAYPRPAQVFGDKERGKLREQAASQRHLAFRTRNLMTWIESQRDDARFLSHRAGTAIDEATGHMSSSVEALENRQLRDAIESQTAALELFARLRDDLKRGDDIVPIESRPAQAATGVEIPAPDEYAVPAEYRKDILEAMRDEAPSDYREAIRKYYEILVR